MRHLQEQSKKCSPSGNIISLIESGFPEGGKAIIFLPKKPIYNQVSIRIATFNKKSCNPKCTISLSTMKIF